MRAIGIDVGGTKTALGLVDPDGTLRSLERLSSRDAGSSESLLAAIADRCARLADLEAPTSIGVALPELVDNDGELRSHVSVDWTRARIVEALEPVAPVAIDADVRAAALAEARVGAGRDAASIGYVSVGTGISATLVLDGVPYAGAHGAAELLGSATLPADCPRCGARITVPGLEDVASGPALVDRYRRESGVALATGEELLALGTSGDEVASAVLSRGAELVGGYVALLVNVVDPEVVVVGGGLGSADDQYLEALVASARGHIWAEHVVDAPIVAAELGGSAGVVGAGLLALDRSSGTLG